MSAPSETATYGRFGIVNIYTPEGANSAPHDVTLLLSSEAGWGTREDAVARRLQDAGGMVIGIDSGHYFAQLEQSAEKCATPSADLENLSHYAQSKAQLKEYIEPILMGYEGGGELAYAALAEAPAGLFHGAMSVGFCPDVNLNQPLCTAEATATPVRKSADGSPRGITLLPARTLPGKWVALQADTVVCGAATRKFVNKVSGAELVSLAKVEGSSPAPEWPPELDAAFKRVAARREVARREPHAQTLPASLADLPLIIVPAAHADASQWFGVFLSGDGGWVGIDKGVAKELAGHDIPIVGWDSLKYFWSKRTPEGASADLDRVIRYFASAWAKSHVLLIGYSQGADTMPFMINRLPEATHDMVGFTTLLGISDNAVFEFHVTNWVGNAGGGIPTAPELSHWRGAPYLCLYGESDSDAACDQLTGAGGEAIKLSGGHHFGGSYGHIANLIISRLPGAVPGKTTR